MTNYTKASIRESLIQLANLYKMEQKPHAQTAIIQYMNQLTELLDQEFEATNTTTELQGVLPKDEAG